MTDGVSEADKHAIRSSILQDEEPVFHYRGRHIEIKSGGLGVNTHVKIDGKEARNITKLTMTITPDNPLVIFMEVIDV
jgi:hypothetical protein